MSIARRHFTDEDGTACVVLDLADYQRLLEAAGLSDDDNITTIENPATGEDIQIDTSTMKPTVIDEIS